MENLTEILDLQNMGVFLIDMAIAILVGILVGHERHVSGKIMGKRSTIILIVGSFLFTYASVHVGIDHGRVIAQIVTGVGFIGAGIIFKKGDKDIFNLTTAILVWTMAAIGVLIGLNMWIEAAISSLVVYFVLHTKNVKEKISEYKNGTKEEKEDDV